MLRRLLLLFPMLCLPILGLAQDQPAPAAPSSVTNLAAVTVSGVQPGPGLWRVSRGDHVLWILGTLSPLPEKMQWQTGDVERAIAGSQQVLGPPGVKIQSKVGFFGKLFLIPSLFRARKNPDGATLQQLVSADDYARWLVLKKQYIGYDHGVERWRPLFAALKLYSKALKRSDLDDSPDTRGKVRDLARRHGITPTPVQYSLEVDDLRGAIKAFTRHGPDDRECFHRAVNGLESELPLIRERANAWATGDVAALRALPQDGARQACLDAITEAGFARQLGLSDLPRRVHDAWVAAAAKALDANRQTFATLPMAALIGPHSVLPALQARGYTVTAPDAPAPEDTPDATAAAAPAPATSAP